MIDASTDCIWIPICRYVNTTDIFNSNSETPLQGLFCVPTVRRHYIECFQFRTTGVLQSNKHTSLQRTISSLTIRRSCTGHFPFKEKIIGAMQYIISFVCNVEKLLVVEVQFIFIARNLFSRNRLNIKCPQFYLNFIAASFITNVQ